MRNFCKKNREFAQFFLAVALKKTVVTTAQLLQFVVHSSITGDPVSFQKIKTKQTAGYRIREKEDWGEFNISWHFYKVLYREILIFCAASWREYSCICSHYVLRFTSFYAMLSPGNFKVPLGLTVKQKRIFRYEGLPEFKWSDLGEQGVVEQGSFGAIFMVFDSSG